MKNAPLAVGLFGAFGLAMAMAICCQAIVNATELPTNWRFGAWVVASAAAFVFGLRGGKS